MKSTPNSVFQAIKYLLKNNKKQIPSYLIPKTNDFETRKLLQTYILEELFHNKSKNLKNALCAISSR